MDIRDVKDFMIQLNEDASIKHQLDELSKATLGRYTQRAFIDAIQKETERGYNLGKRDMGRRFGLGDIYNADVNKHSKSVYNRRVGIDRAIKKLTKEDVGQLDEISKALLRDYIVYAGDDKGDHERHVKDLKKARDALDNVSIGAHRKSLQTSHIEIERAKKLGTDYETQAAADKAAKNTIMNNLWDREQAHKRQITKRNLGIKKALNKLVKEDINNLVFSAIKKLTKEDVNQLDEISKELINNYVKKAKIDLKNTEKEERPLNIKRDKYTSAHYSMRAANNEASRAMSSRDWNRALVKYTKAKKTADSIYTPNDAERHNILKDKIDKRKTGLSLAKFHLNSVKEDVDQLGSSVKENFEFKDLISLTESYRSIFK